MIEPVERPLPPIETRFQPGVSGNPSGRKKAAANFYDDAAAILGAPVTAKMKDKPIKMAPMKAGLRKLCERALKGDKASLQTMFGFILLQQQQIVVADDKMEATYANCERTMIRNAHMEPELVRQIIENWRRGPTPAEVRKNAEYRRRAKAILKQQKRDAHIAASKRGKSPSLANLGRNGA